MGKTSIEWTDHSISPIRARNLKTGKVFHFCERVSPGCKNCYAATMAKRFGLPDYVKANRDKVQFFLDQSKLDEVLKRKKPTRYFWEDCSDLFGDWVPFEWIDKCFAVMALTPQHTHQVLTKRPERMARYLSRDPDYLEVCEELLGTGGDMPLSERQRKAGWKFEVYRDGEGGKDCSLEYHGDLPLPNVWLGTSVEDQKRADERISHLLEVPAKVRFLSCEPLLGPIDLTLDGLVCGECPYCLDKWPCPETNVVECRRCEGFGKGDEWDIDWVIVGGESGPGARPCNVDWIRSIVDQCRAASVPCFVKQLGANVIRESTCRDEDPESDCDCGPVFLKVPLKHSKGGDPSEWPEYLRVREFPAEEASSV